MAMKVVEFQGRAPGAALSRVAGGWDDGSLPAAGRGLRTAGDGCLPAVRRPPSAVRRPPSNPAAARLISGQPSSGTTAT